ncbi:MAG: hypothetical protein V1872_02625 [bacterium]
MQKKIFFIFLTFSSILLLFISTTHASNDIKPYEGIIGIHTKAGGGCCSFDEIISLCQQKKIKILITNDYFLKKFDYGYFPFKKLFFTSYEKPCIFNYGTNEYLSDLAAIDQNTEDILILPGLDVIPFYYWTGAQKKNLTCNDAQKEIFVMGLDETKIIEKMPLLSVNKFSLMYTPDILPLFLLYFIPLILSIIIYKWGGAYKYIGSVIFIFSILLLFNNLPFRNSLYDQYHGDQGIGPYAELLNYVEKNNGITFWAHPEKRFLDREDIPNSKTLPYPEVLIESNYYNGFSAFYDNAENTLAKPGNMWDKILIDYCQSERKKPVWAIGETDISLENGNQKGLSNTRTSFLLDKPDRESLINALHNGKMYVTKSNGNYRLLLNKFTVFDKENAKETISGGKISAKEPEIFIEVSAFDNFDFGKIALETCVTLIRNGEVIKVFKGPTPLSISYKDESPLKGGLGYYRIYVESDDGNLLISNPIFVKFATTIK